MPDDGGTDSDALAEALGAGPGGDGEVGAAAETCPLAESQVRVVELVEVVTHGTTTTTQAPPSREQYINLDNRVDTATAHPDFGRVIHLKARIAWVSGDPTRSLAGKTVYWYATAGGSNKAGLTGSEPPGFNVAGSNTLRTTAGTDTDGWTSVVDFHLSLYGGDQFTLSATEASSYTGGQSAGPYTVWRKFWYQVTEMTGEDGNLLGLPADVSSAFEAGYETVFMRFEEQGPRTQANHVANAPTDAERAAIASPHFVNNDRVPFKLHVVTIDFAYNPTEANISDTMTAPVYTTSNYHFLWNRGTATHPWKVRARFRPTGAQVWHCRRTQPACPGHSSRSHSCAASSGTSWNCGARDCPGHSAKAHRCEEGVWHCGRTQPPCPGHSARSHQCEASSGTSWNCGERNCPGHSQRSHQCSHNWQDIPDGKLSLVAHATRTGFKQIRIDFSAGPVTPSSTMPVEFELRVKKFDTVALGWGGGSTSIYLCTGTCRDWFAAGDVNLVQRSDLVHEGGHALGLVNMTPSPANAHNAWLDPSHSNHCVKPPADCTMYYASSTTRATTFHLDGGAGCHDALRRQDYARGSMAHWTP